MPWLISILAALLTGITSLFLAGFIANACTSWYHVSSREGASGYFVIFLALGGGIAGIVIGLITARIVAANYGSGFPREFGAALGVVLLISGTVALLCRLLADVPPTIDGRELTLEVEFRFPASTNLVTAPTAVGEWTFQLASLAGHTQRNSDTGTVATDKARLESGRWIVPTEVLLFTERGKRSVSLFRNDSREVFGFLLPLPRRPGKAFEAWSDWIPRQQADGQPWPADKMSCRFRVQKVPLPPPPPTREEWEAEAAAKKEAEFAAIPTDSPVEVWFPYLAYEQPQAERALRLVANRPDLVAELSKLAVGENAKLAHDALDCISKLPAPSREFIPTVEAAARVIAARIKTFNDTPVEADPSFEGAVDPATRFYGWLPAAKALREKCGADFTGELKIILELSRVRPESHCMRSDICRVASFYLHEWAGVAPLPTDPKPL
ncbi:MAG TPA: hypothetical protein VFZ59_16650 [Verrucomicrobiae bacterium]|nr:hypothetical protein [Verrucomicrobiae bacterium]